jgi:hypothetical protein
MGQAELALPHGAKTSCPMVQREVRLTSAPSPALIHGARQGREITEDLLAHGPHPLQLLEYIYTAGGPLDLPLLNLPTCQTQHGDQTQGYHRHDSASSKAKEVS